MKSTPSLVPDSGPQSVVESFHKAPGDNPVQQVLRAALERLGPNGERWYQGNYCNDERTAFCAIGALGPTGERDVPKDGPIAAAIGLLHSAAESISNGKHRAAGPYNDAPAATFTDIQSLFAHAITLAGQQVGV